MIEDKPHPLDENIRRVERGSRIVVAVTQDTKVILQVREQEYFKKTSFFHGGILLHSSVLFLTSYGKRDGV